MSAAQRLAAVSFALLPCITIEAIRALATADRAETSIAKIVLTAGTAILEPRPGLAKWRLAVRLGSAAPAGREHKPVLRRSRRRRSHPASLRRS